MHMAVTSGGLQRHRVLVVGAAYPQALARLDRFFEVELHSSGTLLEGAELALRLAGKSALMATRTGAIDGRLLAMLPHLKVVSKMVPAHAEVDLAACTRASVIVTNTPDLGDGAPARAQMALLAAENLIAAFGFGRGAHPQDLLNTELRCLLGCCV